MNANGTERRARLTTKTGTAVSVLALSMVGLLALLVLGALPGPAASGGQGTGGSHFQTFVTPATGFWVNRSQTAGTYVPEYVSLNNTSTLYKLPMSVCTSAGGPCTVTLTLSATNCRWVNVMNLTQAVTPATIFHNVQYRNVTVANASSTLDAAGATHGFKICGGSVAWINFVYWGYSAYDFSAAAGTLGVNATVHVGFGAFPGTTAILPNASATIGPKGIAQFIIPTNLSFTVVLPTGIGGVTTCDPTGQICSYPQYNFANAGDTYNTSTSVTIAFTAASGLKVTNTWENWTVTFTTATIQANTPTGAFFASTETFFSVWIYQLWYAWIVLLLVIVVLAVATSKSHRRR